MEDNDIYEDDFDQELEYWSDTAECILCGSYYCTCCGCNCWMCDDEDEEESS